MGDIRIQQPGLAGINNGTLEDPTLETEAQKEARLSGVIVPLNLNQIPGMPGHTLPVEAQGAPQLPNVQGPTAGTTCAQPVIAWLQSEPKLAHALAFLAENASENFRAMAELRNVANNNEYAHQMASADAQYAQVQGERASAWTQFAGAMAGGAAGIGGAFIGGKKGWFTSNEQTAGEAAAAQMLAQPIMQMFTQTTNVIDTNMGGKYDADQAKIRMKYEDVMVSLFKGQEDNLNSAVEEAKKAMSAVYEMMRQIDDGKHQTLTTVNGNIG